MASKKRGLDPNIKAASPREFLIDHMHTDTYMVRQISLSEKAYRKLKRAKKEFESFSDVILRTVSAPSGDLDRFIGAWKDEDFEKIEAKILADRRGSKR